MISPWVMWKSDFHMAHVEIWFLFTSATDDFTNFLKMYGNFSMTIAYTNSYRNIFSYSPKLDSRGALGPLSMVLVCGSMTKTWVLPISEVFDLFLDNISMAFAACFLIHSSEQKIHPSFGSLSQQKQVFFLTTTCNIKQILLYIH